MSLLHLSLPDNVGPPTARPLLYPRRVQDEGHGEQGRVQFGRRAAVGRALAVVDVDAAVVLQVQALVKVNGGSVK